MTTRPIYRPFGAFRFLLAMMVLVQHGLLLLPPDARAGFYALELGAIAVAVFFALSGFIVAEACATFYAGRPAAFLANRALRVVPPYLAALLLTVAADSLLFAAGHPVALDAPLHGPPWRPRVLLAGLLEIVPGLPAHRISGQDFSFIPFAWSLRVEFAFYLLAAAACWWRTGSVWVLAALYGGFAVFLLGQGHAGRQLLNAPFFAFGVGVFLYRKRRTFWVRANLLVLSACVPVAFILCGQRGHPVAALQLPILAALFGALLLLSGAPPPRPAWQARDRQLGALSYPIYIAHGVVLTALAGLTPRLGWGLYGAGMAASLLLAAILHAAVEKPLRGLRSRVRRADI